MNSNSTYRPEIDGLRAVSVLLVILHHLGFSAVSGGYIGVDVFFVISGYLISKIVASQIQDGSFSLKNFYKRRIIRLAPAYFLVLAITTLASMMVMLPAELLAYFKSVIFSTLFSANFFMWREVGGYFGVLADHVPLLHLWSLAVEEQFYIFWPLVLLALFKVVRAKHIWIVVAIAALVGLWVSEWGVNNYRAAAYYLMPTRAFELMIGALITFLPRLRVNAGIANSATLLGLVLIMHPALTYTKESFFPGLNALSPCLGAALIIAFSSNTGDVVGRVLASAPLNFVGRISYPAYLWHWPLIVFLKIYLVEINIYIAVGVVAVTLLLSALTYWYAEKPAKKMQDFQFSKVAVCGFFLPAVLFLSITQFAEIERGWPSRFDESLNVRSEAILSYSNKIRGRCNEGNVTNPFPPEDCVLGVNKPGVDILLIGDSHANHYTGMIDVMAKDAGLRGYDITQSQTIYLPEARRFYVQDGQEVEHLNFYARNKILQQKISQGKYKHVVLGSSFSISLKGAEYSLDGDDHRSGKQVFQSQLERAITEIIESGAVPYIIKGNPYYSWAIQSCTLNNQRFQLYEKCNMDIVEYRKIFEEWTSSLDILKKKFPQIVVIDPALVMCDELNCFSELEGVPLYRDGGHLNHIGSKLIGEIYIKRLGNPFRVNATLGDS
jgi:peptidoglycan/LPS O-acetylase OafA/YrhL